MSKITVDRALIDQALEVLTDNRADIARCESAPYMAQYYDKAISDLREALAQPQQEPVAWMRPSDKGYDSAFRDHGTVVACKGNKWEGWVPLYTSPPARKPLKDEEIDAIWHKDLWRMQKPHHAFARAIEAAHGIKETP